MHWEVGRVVAFLVFGLFGGVAAGQEAKDMKLEDLGFIMRPANTPEQMARLRLLPPRKFVTRSKDGRRYYVYADADYCRCAFVGDELAMKNYRDLVSPPPQAPMAIGSGDSLVENGIVVEEIPGMTIVDGDIFDAPF
jgi:hypothetical protein